MSRINGKIESIIDQYNDLTNDEKNTLIYILNKDYNLQDHLNSETYQKRWVFKGKNYFSKMIVDKIFYAYTKDDVIDCVKKLSYLFRTKQQLELIATNDNYNISEDEIKHIISRYYSNAITSYEIIEYSPNNTEDNISNC